jgi:predicted membrane channel-forming protein YqfA (hemolysin III family)
VAHFLGALAGGIFYILGSAFYYWPDSSLADFLGAFFYIVGSVCLLLSDFLEVITTLNRYQRINIALSTVGSIAYIVGSVGYLPAIDESDNAGLGEYGFIIGSVWVVASQTWKVRCDSLF